MIPDMIKATHSGHCQACGRLQKMPKGVMSLHGYNVTHGFFSGTCAGAKELPFELSCDLVKLFIASAQSQLESLEAFQASLRVLPTTPVGWVRVRYENPKGRYYQAIYKWEQCTFSVEAIQHGGHTDPKDDFTSYRYLYVDASGREHGRNLSESEVDGPQSWDGGGIEGKTTAELVLMSAQRYNETYAKWLEHEAVNLRRYIKWQTERVTKWVARPEALLPVDAKDDKQGFKPTEPAY